MRCPVLGHDDHQLVLVSMRQRNSSPLMYVTWECPVEGLRFIETPEGATPSDPNYVQHLGERQS